MKDKVKQAARELGLQIDVTSLERPTRTVAEAAAAVGCEAPQIAKSLVFIADGDPVMVVASGAHRVDVDLLADAFDVAEVRQATPEEVRAATGYPIGGVAPIGVDLPVVFDERLLECQAIYAAGGDGNTLFEVEPRRLAESIGAKVAPVGER